MESDTGSTGRRPIVILGIVAHGRGAAAATLSDTAFDVRLYFHWALLFSGSRNHDPCCLEYFEYRRLLNLGQTSDPCSIVGWRRALGSRGLGALRAT